MDNVIIVPLYKNELTQFEHISLKQCFKTFNCRIIIAIKPKNLNLSNITKQYPFTNVVSFDDEFFIDINGYNKLMLSAIFYEQFLSYKYMLIYQTDAFVFSDKLGFWTNSGYDYIGAPWLRPLKYNNWFNRKFVQLKSIFYIRFNITQNRLPKSKQLYNKVGNGGFSLRNINKFYNLAIKEKLLAEYYINLKNPAFNEDLFWSIEINRKNKQLNIPNFKTAALFAIETYPEFGFDLTKQELPFGCHAWEKNLIFWKNKIQSEGYVI
jgi:hypothetical protein